MVVESARAEPAVRTLGIGEGRRRFSDVPAPDEASVCLIDIAVPDEKIHVETGAEVGLRIYGVRKPGTLEEQDFRTSEAVQEHTEFGVAELLDQFRRAESLSGLLADPHRDAVGAPEEGGEQEVDKWVDAHCQSPANSSSARVRGSDRSVSAAHSSASNAKAMPCAFRRL